MRIEEEYMDVMQNIEAAVVMVYHQQPQLSDADVDRAYAALVQTYRNEAVGRAKVEPAGEAALAVYRSVASLCEWRLGRETDLGSDGPAPDPLTVDVILQCLKRLRRSVEKWSSNGSRGYLDYISQFVLG